jgi:hypothetical protein
VGGWVGGWGCAGLVGSCGGGGVQRMYPISTPPSPAPGGVWGGLGWGKLTTTIFLSSQIVDCKLRSWCGHLHGKGSARVVHTEIMHDVVLQLAQG